MGELTGVVQFTGKFDGLSFYKMNGKIVVRKTGGFKGDLIKKDSKYERTRENANEFGHCSKVGKVFRVVLSLYLKLLSVPYLHNRVLKMFKSVMVFDEVSLRGQRKVGLGILSDEGKKILNGFEFDEKNQVGLILNNSYEVDLEKGFLFFSNLDVGLVKFPISASHVELEFIIVRMDFDLMKGFFVGSQIVLKSKKEIVSACEMRIDVSGNDEGVLIGLLMVSFKQKVNNEFYDLADVVGLRILGSFKI